MKLSQWAKEQQITYVTAYNWFRAGKLPVKAIQTATGTILIQPEPLVNHSAKKTTIYCRVSSHNKKDDLERQVQRCEEFCRANGWEIHSVIKEIGSGMNDNRKKLQKLLISKPERIVVEHKDRLTRFGFNYLETLLPQIGCDIIVINRDYEGEQDLMKDLVSVITSFCCRLYGLRKGRDKVKNIKKELV